MDPSLPSPSRRDDSSPQGEGEDLEKIASQMEWDDEYNANAVWRMGRWRMARSASSTSC